MIRDLIGAGSLQARTEILVIGAGTAGLVLATELAARGRQVLCLESGGREQDGDTHPLNAVDQIGTEYAGAEHGRFRCLGGTSTRWGGALIPLQGADLAGSEWPLAWNDLSPWLPRVEELFSLPTGPYDDPTVLPGSDYLARLAKWPAFRRRNVYSLLRRQLEAREGPHIWINATASGFRVQAGRLEEVVAHAPDGNSISVVADEVVIAAGAIESTRLLLLLDRQNDGCLSQVGSHLGRGFHDHLSAKVAEVVPKERDELNHLVGFRFDVGGSMRNLRFELAPTTTLRSTVVPSFAHVGFAATDGGFSALRDTFRALQRRKAPPPRVLARLFSDIPWLLRAAWWRFVRGRLLYPENARLELHMVIEQPSRSENRISLSDERSDPYGQPLACIDWKVGAEDIAAMECAISSFANGWKQGPLGRLADLALRPTTEVARALTTGGGIYHPGGATRVGASPSEGVVDAELRVFGLPNVAVCSTSVLPRGGGANPTMMLLLLALRFTERLA